MFKQQSSYAKPLKSDHVIHQQRSSNPLVSAVSLLIAIVGWSVFFVIMLLGTLFTALSVLFQPAGESGQIKPPQTSESSTDSWGEQI